jgi:MtN3 and saliva related transmembrane protein
MKLTPYIGYLAGILSVVAFFPQVVRTWRTKKTKDLSIGMFSILITAGLLWSTYGFLSKDWPVLATNLAMVILNGAILTAKLRYK